MRGDIKLSGALFAALAIAIFITAMEEPLAFDSREQIGIKGLKKGVFLIAAPKLSDPHFSRTVILILTYEKQGALGLIINRPTETTLEKALPDLSGIEKLSLPLFFGGPVGQGRIMALLLPDKPPEEAKRVFGNVYVAEDKKPLIEVIQRPDPEKKIRIYSGYAGWGPGQLDGEVARMDWIIVGADPEMIFSENPSGVWEELIKRGKEIEVDDYARPADFPA